MISFDILHQISKRNRYVRPAAGKWSPFKVSPPGYTGSPRTPVFEGSPTPRPAAGRPSPCIKSVTPWIHRPTTNPRFQRVTFLALPGYTGSPRTPVFEGWPKAHMRALSDLQHARILICYFNLQHLATCSTPEYWFSIVTYSTWRLAAHHNIEHLL